LITIKMRGRCGHDRMVVGFTTTCASVPITTGAVMVMIVQLYVHQCLSKIILYNNRYLVNIIYRQSLYSLTYFSSPTCQKVKYRKKIPFIQTKSFINFNLSKVRSFSSKFVISVHVFSSHFPINYWCCT
jgi:hypothetical protein